MASAAGGRSVTTGNVGVVTGTHVTKYRRHRQGRWAAVNGKSPTPTGGRLFVATNGHWRGEVVCHTGGLPACFITARQSRSARYADAHQCCQNNSAGVATLVGTQRHLPGHHEQRHLHLVSDAMNITSVGIGRMVKVTGRRIIRTE